VGGVGDVVRDLPVALAALGWQATILTPAYGSFHTLPGCAELAPIEVHFRGEKQRVRVFEMPSANTVLFDHPFLVPTTPGRVYHDDPAGRPFATDDLHDWHAAYFLLHREFTDYGASLKKIPTVFTIHNLAYQGQRPLRGDESSLEAWHPDMRYDPDLLGDPNAADCINPMAFAIRCADHINTVSPTYAQEIQCPSNPETGFIGGEGLEQDLVTAAEQGRLSGILNGCDYSVALGRRPGWQRLVISARDTLHGWLDNDKEVHERALTNLSALPKRRPLYVLTSVGRLVSQKMQLFLQPLADGRSALEHILDKLGPHGVLFILGSGDAAYEEQLHRIATAHPNLVFLRGYAEDLGNLMYHGGDLFLMPSSFEPCGISQMLAMRAGQPCVVHGVGGLHDTVENGVTGFVFAGSTPADQATGFVATVERALQLRHDHPNRWQTMQKNAAAQRFDWTSSARQYVEQMYEPHRG
jgi:starch synthase